MWGSGCSGCWILSAVRRRDGRASSSGGGSVDGSGGGEGADGALDFGGMGDGEGGPGQLRAAGSDLRAGEFGGVDCDAGSATGGNAFVLREEDVQQEDRYRGPV